MTRRVIYVSGTRADYGLMQKTLARIAAAPELDLAIVATGMHLSATYGMTVTEIERDGFVILDRVTVDMDGNSGASMARGIGTMTSGFTDIFEHHAPDIVLLLGDRGEMLAAAIAALHLGIAIAHIHGGERSGTVNEPVLQVAFAPRADTPFTVQRCSLAALPSTRSAVLVFDARDVALMRVKLPQLSGARGSTTHRNFSSFRQCRCGCS